MTREEFAEALVNDMLGWVLSVAIKPLSGSELVIYQRVVREQMAKRAREFYDMVTKSHLEHQATMGNGIVKERKP